MLAIFKSREQTFKNYDAYNNSILDDEYSSNLSFYETIPEFALTRLVERYKTVFVNSCLLYEFLSVSHFVIELTIS